MAGKFVMADAWAKKVETRVNDSFAIRQSPGEGLRDFLSQFNKVRMTLPNVSEGMAVAAFQNAMNREGSKATRKLLSRLIKYPPATWDEIYNAYCVEIGEDDEDLNGPTRRLISVQSEPWREHRDNTRRDPPMPRSDVIYALEKLGSKVKWPPKMRSDPRTRKSDAFCEFHKDRGHKTEDCHALRLEVANLLQQGHLKEFLSDKGRNTLAKGRERPDSPKPPSPAPTINMIIEGSDDAFIKNIKFTATHKFKRSITPRTENYGRQWKRGVHYLSSSPRTDAT
uniref:Uncharacterized protein LOC104218432 n=1 Tax=Nicotiana sylvestris TaxID=4096 RepID=A0A1U7VGL3_NICSY|nr:PREDICTED: uncharacterized protein LOC104218432 [Nicotiana sylvestris]